MSREGASLKRADERRKNKRELCADFVQIAWCDQQGRRISTVGVLEDVSPAGLCLNVEHSVPLSMRVHLHTKGFEGEAEVRHCELADYGYLVGVEFVDGCSWDRDRWQPKHLLSLER
jgi:hypothetical protein